MVGDEMGLKGDGVKRRWGDGAKKRVIGFAVIEKVIKVSISKESANRIII